MDARKVCLYLVLICLLLFPSVGLCENGYFRASADAKERAAAMKKVGVLFIDLKVYEFTAGGVREAKEEWIEAAKGNFSASLGEELKGRSMEAKVLGEEASSEELEDIRILYDAVRDAILRHTFGPSLNWDFFPAKLDRFDYSLGPLDQLLARLNVDGLILMSATDEVSTGGRKALMVVGAFTGIVPRSGITWANAALVDGTGSILWFSANPGRSYDLREADQVSRLLGRMLSEFPKARN